MLRRRHRRERRGLRRSKQSNFPMQRLLATLGFDRSGFIENLDEGDPELVYFKRIRDNAT